MDDILIQVFLIALRYLLESKINKTLITESFGIRRCIFDRIDDVVRCAKVASASFDSNKAYSLL